MKLTYRLPELGDERILLAYREEHYAAGEKSISASMGLAGMPFQEWVGRMRKNAAQPDGDWGRNETLLCFEGERLVGLLSVRYEMAEQMRWKYGDIGYGVRPSERGKGCATEMLKRALIICREKGMKDAVIGCYKDNIASAKVIINNGGMLVHEADSYENGRISQYYRIGLTKEER